jgi:Na+/H+ antiporter NhaD/arsenite permease-like protein
MEFFNVYNILIVMTFIVGYLFITIEHVTHVNKSAIALIMAVLCWVFKIADPIHSSPLNLAHLSRHMAEISQIVFFLMGALTIVEIINVHKGFNRFSKWMYFKSKRKFLWVISFSTFFLSSILDNLTTTIIMISFIQKFIKNREEKLLIGGAIVIAANAGGAWTPIGDVTTTMLWIGGQLSTLDIIQHLFFPSLICLIASLFVLSFSLKGTFQEEGAREAEDTEPSSNLILYLGLSVLLFVPIFKVLTGLPPSLGMLLGLGIIRLSSF